MKRKPALWVAIGLCAGLVLTSVFAYAGDAEGRRAARAAQLAEILAERDIGEVLYHQDFSVLGELEESGILRGTSSSENSYFTCVGDSLELDTYDNERVYALLPKIGVEDSYTIEFDFAFSEIGSKNGYIGFLLTSRGTEPTNITSLTIRANGTVDDFESPCQAIVEAIEGGGTVKVKIPIEKNVLNEIELSANGTVCVLERDSVKVIDDGGMGFVVRNASVDVSEIFVVHGTGYATKNGKYATESYASDPIPISTIDDTVGAETSPETCDPLVPCAAALTMAAMGLFRRKNHG